MGRREVEGGGCGGSGDGGGGCGGSGGCAAPHHFLDGDVAVREGPVPLLVQAVVPVTVQDQLQELHPEQVSSYQCFGSDPYSLNPNPDPDPEDP